MQDSSLTLVYGRKFGLVGRNGFGKTYVIAFASINRCSTLFRALSNGDIPLPHGLNMLHVEQEVIGDDTTALDSVLLADVERSSLISEEKALVASQDKSEATDKRLAEIYQKLTEIDADTAPAMYVDSFLCYDINQCIANS